MRLLAGETKERRQQEYLNYIKMVRSELKFYEHLHSKYPLMSSLIRPIIKFYADEIKLTINNMVELGKL